MCGDCALNEDVFVWLCICVCVHCVQFIGVSWFCGCVCVKNWDKEDYMCLKPSVFS